MTDLLCEIGCEELPTASVDKLSLAFLELITAELHKAGLKHGKAQRFATPRRLAVIVESLQEQQPPRQIERQGPMVTQAYDKQGTPTLACLGFAKSCGVAVDQLETQDTPKGKRLFCNVSQPGIATRDALPGIIQSAIKQLPLPKVMRWGSHDIEFIRPVHWVVLLFGREVIATTLLGCQTSNHTYGHRFHYPKALRVSQPKDYSILLYSQGYVFADIEKRRAHIQKQVTQAANRVGEAMITPELLDEVNALVEWPTALLGQFDAKFLSVPEEVLITAMHTHQKCFPVKNKNGELLPNFVLVSNINSKDPEQVVHGNERVINARLSDAAFFFANDLKHTLESRLETLNDVMFQQQLGSMAQRSLRIAALAKRIAASLGIDASTAERAGRLCKCDLVSEMVTEFPDLQGIMGGYYARNDGEAEDVAIAIKEHYLPRFAGDLLPNTLTGCAVSIASRLDTLIGILGINKIPSGEKDPYALRRAAQGILRIVLEKQLDLDLYELLTMAEQEYQAPLENKNVVTHAHQFMLERLRSWYLDKQITPEVFEAVLACQPSRPIDFHRRIEAVLAFQKLPEAAALAAANKRVSNILKKINGTKLPAHADSKLFDSSEERELAQQMQRLEKQTLTLTQSANYTQALSELAAIKNSVDAFFDKVMVMVDDEPVRINRLALLSSLHGLLTQVADISLLPP